MNRFIYINKNKIEKCIKGMNRRIEVFIVKEYIRINNRMKIE